VNSGSGRGLSRLRQDEVAALGAGLAGASAGRAPRRRSRAGSAASPLPTHIPTSKRSIDLMMSSSLLPLALRPAGVSSRLASASGRARTTSCCCCRRQPRCCRAGRCCGAALWSCKHCRGAARLACCAARAAAEEAAGGDERRVGAAAANVGAVAAIIAPKQAASCIAGLSHTEVLNSAACRSTREAVYSWWCGGEALWEWRSCCGWLSCAGVGLTQWRQIPSGWMDGASGLIVHAVLGLTRLGAWCVGRGGPFLGPPPNPD
jgi:hypothetical protein